jgi:hypothetical protein
MNVGLMRMVQVVIIVFFMVHLMSCFWFLSASFDDMNPNTWVARAGILEDGASY